MQVRASVTPLPAVMEGRVTITETPSCVAAPQAGAAAPVTQVRPSLHSNHSVLALVISVMIQSDGVLLPEQLSLCLLTRIKHFHAEDV